MNTLWLPSLVLVLPVLQKAPPEPEDVTQGWLGAVVFFLLAAATVLLWLSFRKQLKKVDFEEEPDPPRRTHER
ncbi:MAG TPA: hypothetical protein VER39_05040 [Nocardioidaceae bacterium]|nr:hypothetical protein [Nocardioidaceae bacterium]